MKRSNFNITDVLCPCASACSTIVASLFIAFSPASAVTEYVGGVSMSNPQWLAQADWQKEIDAVRHAGSWIRLPINWDELQPSASTPVANWNWSTYDAIIDYARPATGKQLYVLVILGSVPGWANGNGGYGKPATNLADYQNYCYQVAYRYLIKGVNTYQIGNEINLPHPGWSENSSDYYLKFMVPGSTGVQQASIARNIGYNVVMGSLAPNTWFPSSPHPNTFLGGIYTAAGGNGAGNGKWRWGTLAYHPYVNPDPVILPSAQTNMNTIPGQLYATMTTYQESGKQLWATEFGAPTYGNNSITEANLAIWVDDVVNKWYSYSYAGPLFWYTCRDKVAYGGDMDREKYFGLLHFDFSAKLAYSALKCRFSSALLNGTYKVIARHSGKAMEVTNWGTTDGTAVQQWSWLGGNNQRWTFELQTDGYYEIKPNHTTGKNLDVNGGSGVNGTKIQIWTDNNGNNQRFKIENLGGGYYRVTPKVSLTSCLDVEGAGTGDGTRILEWTWGGGNNQQWQIVPLF